VLSTLLEANLGPDFAGWAGQADGRMICVAPPEIHASETLQSSMRETVKRAGGDCTNCRGCWLGN